MHNRALDRAFQMPGSVFHVGPFAKHVILCAIGQRESERRARQRLVGRQLEVEVTSVAANRIRDLDRRGVQWKIFKDINIVNVNYRPFDASPWPLTDCGLLGPVTLTALQK